jgi:phage-related minor tail protein
MSGNASRQSGPVANRTGDAITQYLAALQQFYPAAKGATSVVVRPDRRVIVTTPLPTRARERMRLFDQMAEVGTRLLLETDQYIILAGR